MASSKTKVTFNRIENKYIITREQYNSIIDVISLRLSPDKHAGEDGMYQVYTLYYDTPDMEFARRIPFNPGYKEKIRLRAYGKPHSESLVFIEIKKKIGSYSNKRRQYIPLEDIYDFIENGQIENYDTQVLHEIYALMKKHKFGIKPTVMLTYDRRPFNSYGLNTANENFGLRISFDTNVKWRTHDLRLEMGDYGQNVFDDDFIIMEIKLVSSMPLWLSQLLSSKQIFPRNLSKYRTAFERSL